MAAKPASEPGVVVLTALVAAVIGVRNNFIQRIDAILRAFAHPRYS